MLALYRDGRRAEALAAYQHSRRVLVDELGIEPGAELRQLHQQILVGDVAADSGRRAPPSEAGPAIPRQLPAPVAHFTGRGAELAVLDRLVDSNGVTCPGGAVIAAICGTAGVGKTALAVHWAHRVAARFPDGQFYLNLRGYDLEQPVTTGDALAGFLRALGTLGRDIPAETDERVMLYRSLLASRRMLIVLDNARETEQLRELLPGTPACMTVVTSRDSLAGLVARDGATRVDLDLLSPADAVGLLGELIGPRADADPGAAGTLAALCSRLPLALRVAAELAAARPATGLAELVDELANVQRRLDLLHADGDPRTAVRTVFSWSYRHLDADAAGAFRLAGLHPGPGFDVYAVAALTGMAVEQTTRVLDRLARAHLIQVAGPGRYGLHDLLRAYAAEQAAAQDGEQAPRTALARLFDFYLLAAHVAMDVAFPADLRRPGIPMVAAIIPPLADATAAGAWLDAEWDTLIAVAAYTATRGWPGHTVALAATLCGYLEAGRFDEAVSIHGHALRAARDVADPAAEAAALANLGLAYCSQGGYQQARDHLQRALALYRGVGDQAGEAFALTSLGSIERQQGLYQKATEHLHHALALYRTAGDRHGEARALSSIGVVDRRQGRYQQAAEHQRRALALFRATGERVYEAETRKRLGTVALCQGDLRPAARYLNQALTLFIETGDRCGQAETLTCLGDLAQGKGHYEQGIDLYQRALALCRQIGNRACESDALNGLGEALLATGRPGSARNQHAAALSLATQTGDEQEQANAHHGLGNVYDAMGDCGQARRHWQQALARYASLGAPEANLVRARLNTADHDGQR